MTVYQQARRFSLSALAVIVTIPLWGSALLNLHEGFLAAAGALWVSAWAIAIFFTSMP
ncbi:hypothetical protein [Sphingosinicella rhizophila]|uniref:Uncharacterized protein n=1 Tax=Sphingosinicella rhizophila TaxID=3050082 RepID=A0ABU3Q242_9SPHN|nr:hypothetical protein [Sphingosinicella sp. GR2756]MDT9597332.1 hypothetical protein [Sphingosinicella sp. GR2756]